MDPQNPLLLRAAGELADEIREGQWRHIDGLEVMSAQDCDEIVAELRSRCSGFTRAEYQAAIAEGLLAPSSGVHRSLRSTLLYWTIACTFIWGFFVCIFGGKKVPELNEWFGLFLYPTMCGAAAFYVIRSKGKGRVTLVSLNVGLGVAWIMFVMWAAYAFAHSFLK